MGFVDVGAVPSGDDQTFLVPEIDEMLSGCFPIWLDADHIVKRSFQF
jgi:hypothetical protein